MLKQGKSEAAWAKKGVYEGCRRPGRKEMKSRETEGNHSL